MAQFFLTGHHVWQVPNLQAARFDEVTPTQEQVRGHGLAILQKDSAASDWVSANVHRRHSFNAGVMNSGLLHHLQSFTQRGERNSSTVIPMTVTICRRSNGEVSRPEWNRCSGRIGVTVLSVGTPLSDFTKAEFLENRCDLPWLQNRGLGHFQSRTMLCVP
jgi:hypothetical protein